MMSPIAHRGEANRIAGAFTETALEKVEKVLVILVNAQFYPPYPGRCRARNQDHSIPSRNFWPGEKALTAVVYPEASQ
jgi:hypothetical protein